MDLTGSIISFVLFPPVFDTSVSTSPHLRASQTPTVSTSTSAISLHVDQPPTHLPGVWEHRHTAGCSSPDPQQTRVQPQLQHTWKSQTSIKTKTSGTSAASHTAQTVSEWSDKQEVMFYKCIQMLWAEEEEEEAVSALNKFQFVSPCWRREEAQQGRKLASMLQHI